MGMLVTREIQRQAFRTGDFELDTDSTQAHGLVGWWPMVVNGGGLEHEYSGRHNPGTWVNSPTRTLSVHPKWGPIHCLLIDDSEEVNVPDNDEYEVTGNFTFMGWIKRNSEANEDTLLMYDNRTTTWSGSYVFEAFSDGRILLNHQNGSSGQDVVSGTVGGIGTEWTHIAASHFAGKTTLYVNGLDDGGAQTHTSPNYGSTNAETGLHIGRYVADGFQGSTLDGLASDVRIYRRGLFPGEIYDAYSKPWEIIRPKRRRRRAAAVALVNDQGSAFTDSDKTGQNNWNSTTSLTVNDGELVVVVFVTDNDSSSDGNTSLHTSISLDGQAMSLAREYTNSEGGSDLGSTVSVWYLVADGEISSSSVVATVNSQGKTAKAVSAQVFTIPANQVVTVDGVQDGGTTGADPESLTATGATDGLHLWIRGIGLEDAVENVGTMVSTPGWSTFDEDGSTGGADATNQTVAAEFKSTESGTTSGASDPAVSSAPDTASTLVGLLFSDATVALTGTVTSSITESDIVTGGKTIILTLTDSTWVT